MVGLDMMRERSDYYRRTDTINDFDVNNPSYGNISIKKVAVPTEEITNSQYAGLYLRNTRRTCKIIAPADTAVAPLKKEAFF